ncbi:exonuclease domain-containing protein [Paludisphaera sp.]|uniref:exonuclease domain-containing protein n=1 Tax=Paludisphaera sp. TaxID=2017432 RepID=UPI00301BFFB1
MPETIFIAIDLETTGLDVASDRVVEIGAIAFDGGAELERFERLIRPDRPMRPTATAVNGLRDVDLAHAPRAAEVLPEFAAFLDRFPTAPLIAHNAAFDAGFLGMEAARAGIAIPGRLILDTLALARSALPDLRSHRLDLLIEHLSIRPRARHRAMGDAEVLMDLWPRLGGPAWAECDPVAYPIRDGSRAVLRPAGWERLDEAVESRWPIRMAYAGGSRGAAPRCVTPRRFAHRGGIAYLVALCHLDSVEKSFRLDRIRAYEVVDNPGETAWPACSSA